MKNLTSHDLSLYKRSDVTPLTLNGRNTGKFTPKPDATPTLLKNDGMVRINYKETCLNIDGIEIYVKKAQSIEGVEDIPEGDTVVVSGISVAPLIEMRPDLKVLSPGNAVVKDGRIVGCVGLIASKSIQKQMFIRQYVEDHWKDWSVVYFEDDCRLLAEEAAEKIFDKVNGTV